MKIKLLAIAALILIVLVSGCPKPEPPKIDSSFLMGINGIRGDMKEGVERLDFYVQWFDKMDSSSANFMRLRLDGRSIGVEKSPGEIDEQKASIVDEVLRKGKEKGIYFMVTFFNANAGPNYACCNIPEANCEPLLQRNWSSRYHYNSLAGGDPDRFFTDATVIEKQKAIIRKIIERWGDNENIIAWELMNEAMVCKPSVLEWHKEMSSYIKTLSSKPVTTSIRSEKKTDENLWNELWNYGDIDIVQRHVYDSPDLGKDLYRYCGKMGRDYGKPVFFGEFGVWNHGTPDPDGIGLHNALWASFFGKCYGLSYWDTDSHLDANPELYNHFNGLGKFIGNKNYADYEKFSVENDQALIYGLRKANETLLWVRSNDYYWGNKNPSSPTVAGLEINLGESGNATFYNTLTGNEFSHTHFNSVLTAPDFDKDIAVKIIKE